MHATREALAERYLAAERYSLTEVSELLGFTAPSDFSRWFRARSGVSPTEWRSRAQQLPPG
ncbi:helix-turn-helix domain-containing protein [Geodermatophilus sp. SYSU D00965]